MAAEQTENPNTQDAPEYQQVMSPNGPAVRASGDGRPLMNGVSPALRGSHDLDDEVRLPTEPTRGEVGDEGRQAVDQGTMRVQATGPVQGAVTTATAGPDSGYGSVPVMAGAPRATAERSLRQEPEAMSSPGPGGMISGVLRAVQTLPAAVEGLVSRTSSVRGASGTPALRDSVEYASVRSSAQEQPAASSDQELLDQPLFDEVALERMRRMQEGAPLLYQSEAQPLPRPPDPSSASSSDVQAEVRRQLAELMALRDEESRRLRAQVEALAVENHSLRLRAELEVAGGMQNSRSGVGFPGFGWFGRGLGSLMGQVRQPRAFDLGQSTPPPPPPPQPPAPKGLLSGHKRSLEHLFLRVQLSVRGL